MARRCKPAMPTTDQSINPLSAHPADAEGEYDGEQLYGGDAHHCPDDNVEVLLNVVCELVEATLKTTEC